MNDRTWPVPGRSHAMRMNWHDLLFAHWPLEPSQIQACLPPGVAVETFEGQAWIAIVPFHMTDVAPRGVPAIPWLSAFPELNIRTYVTFEGKPGVWFFSLDATNPIAVRIARLAFHLPYMDARMAIHERDGWYEYVSERSRKRNEPTTEFAARYRPTSEVFFAHPGDVRALADGSLLPLHSRSQRTATARRN